MADNKDGFLTKLTEKTECLLKHLELCLALACNKICDTLSLP